MHCLSSTGLRGKLLHLFWGFFAAPIAIEDVVVVGRCKLMHCVGHNIFDANHMAYIPQTSPLSILLCTQPTMWLQLTNSESHGFKQHLDSHPLLAPQPCPMFQSLRLLGSPFPIPCDDASEAYVAVRCLFRGEYAKAGEDTEG